MNPWVVLVSEKKAAHHRSMDQLYSELFANAEIMNRRKAEFTTNNSSVPEFKMMSEQPLLRRISEFDSNQSGGNTKLKKDVLPSLVTIQEDQAQNNLMTNESARNNFAWAKKEIHRDVLKNSFSPPNNGFIKSKQVNQDQIHSEGKHKIFINKSDFEQSYFGNLNAGLAKQPSSDKVINKNETAFFENPKVQPNVLANTKNQSVLTMQNSFNDKTNFTDFKNLTPMYKTNSNPQQKTTEQGNNLQLNQNQGNEGDVFKAFKFEGFK